jgi:ribonuclease Z
MKPTQYRGASAIYFVSKKMGILMDCAEGSYGQIFDHFGSKERVDDVLCKTRVIFITHIHGDHQLGVFKIMQERDKLMATDKSQDTYGKLYIVYPLPMRAVFEHFIKENVKNRPDLIALVPSLELSPETSYYY